MWRIIVYVIGFIMTIVSKTLMWEVFGILILTMPLLFKARKKRFRKIK